MTLAALPPNFKVHKNSLSIISSGFFLPHTTLQPWPKFRWSLPTQGVPFLLPPAGLVWPNRASLMVLLKGECARTSKGLFLAACHYETFQLARRTKTTAREPRLLWSRPGSTSGTARTWTGGQAGFVALLTCVPATGPPARGA